MATEQRHILSRRGLLKMGAAAAVAGVIAPPRPASALLSGDAQASPLPQLYVRLFAPVDRPWIATGV